MAERLTFTKEFREANGLSEIEYLAPDVIKEWDKKLAAYEDLGTVEELAELVKAKEDNRLVVLPCKVGDTVYTLEENYYPCEECDLPEGKRSECYRKKTSYPCTTVHECPTKYKIVENVVEGFEYTGHSLKLSDAGRWGYEGLERFVISDDGIYLTHEEAEAALKEQTNRTP